MKKFLTEEKRKELFEKRKYYREHPEEAHKEALRRKEDYVPIGIMPSPKENK